MLSLLLLNGTFGLVMKKVGDRQTTFIRNIKNLNMKLTSSLIEFPWEVGIASARQIHVYWK